MMGKRVGKPSRKQKGDEILRILIVEDEKRLAETLVQIMTEHKYTADAVFDGESGFDYAMSGIYDVIVLDVMLPKRDGFSVVRRLRARGVSTPVLLLTARSEVPDRVEGLDAGADDYLPKPFAMAELLARVRALVRRRERLVPEVISFAGLSLDLSAYTLSCKGRSARLGNREFQMMEMLMEAPRRIISTAQFMERVWGWDAEVDVSIVWVYVSNLRKKIAQLGADVEIRATRGVGYSLEAKA